MKKLAFLAATFAVVPALFSASTVFAASEGHLSSGPGMYQVKNVTKNTANSSSVSATCNETVKYTLQLANSEFAAVKNIVVKANLATGGITASGTNSVGQTTSVSADVDVNLDKGSLAYVAGSTQVTPILNSSQLGQTTTIADGITAGGVNVGTLNGSTREYVQFQAKVECKEEPKNIKVCELATKQIITIKETDFDSSKHSKNLNDCKKEVPGKITVCKLDSKTVVTINEDDFDASKYSKDLNDCNVEETPEVIASTGPTSAIASMFGLSALTAGIGYAVQRRRNILG